MVEGVAPDLSVEVLTIAEDLDCAVEELFVLEEVEHIVCGELFVTADEDFSLEESQYVCLGSSQEQINEALDLGDAAGLLDD